LTAAIDWGDGSTSAGVVSFDDCSSCEVNVLVTGSHVYDARDDGYQVKVILNDDGGETVSQISDGTVKIADAALTAGDKLTLSESATKAFTATVGSFTDAAGSQAKAADFTAKINWGDGTTSNGTVSQTAAGKFSVSGSHTYASVGEKTVTVNVADEEGATLTFTATVSVCCLPVTGRPQPSPPAWPAMLLTMLGGLFLAGSFVRRRFTL
jgi:hypothetical protein